MLQVAVKCVTWQVIIQALALIFTQRGCQHLTPRFFLGRTPFPFSSLPHSPPHSIHRPWLSFPSPHSRMALPWSWSCITLACKFLHTVWPFRTEVMGATDLQHPPFHPTRRHRSESSQAVTPPSSGHIPSRATLPATQIMHFG